MGSLHYCDWCQKESFGSRISYHTKFDQGFETIERICNECQDTLKRFIKTMKQNRKPYVGYEK
jgi:hypothetical protein